MSTETNPLVSSGEYFRSNACEVQPGDYVAEMGRRVASSSPSGDYHTQIAWEGDGIVSRYRNDTTLLVKTCQLPRPGAVWQSPNIDMRGTVIASVFLDDEAEPPTAVLMLLTEAEPYYAIVDVEWDGLLWRGTSGTVVEFVNIVPASDHWQQAGGDY